MRHNGTLRYIYNSRIWLHFGGTTLLDFSYHSKSSFISRLDNDIIGIMADVSIYLTLAAVVLTVLIWKAKNGALYPPSPPRQWLIGNLLQMPSSTDIKRLATWRDQHGLSHMILRG